MNRKWLLISGVVVVLLAGGLYWSQKGDPVRAEALVQEGVALANQKNYIAAKEKFQAAVEADGRSIDAHYNLAGILITEHDLEGALRKYQEVLALAPDHGLALWWISNVYLEMGNAEQAKLHYQQLMKVDVSFRGRNPTLDALLETP